MSSRAHHPPAGSVLLGAAAAEGVLVQPPLQTQQQQQQQQAIAATPGHRNHPPGGAAVPVSSPSVRLGSGRGGLPVYTEEEIARHCTEQSCWLIVGNKVFDATEMIRDNSHPGGSRAILQKAGKDVSDDFRFHSAKSRGSIWPKYLIGRVAGRSEQSCTLQ